MMEYVASKSGETVIGHKGENRCIALLIPVPPDLSDHAVKLYYQHSSSRPIEIPESCYSVDSHFIQWIISDEVTEKSGSGLFQVVYQSGSQITKSPLFHTLVLPSIDQ